MSPSLTLQGAEQRDGKGGRLGFHFAAEPRRDPRARTPEPGARARVQAQDSSHPHLEHPEIQRGCVKTEEGRVLPGFPPLVVMMGTGREGTENPTGKQSLGNWRPVLLGCSQGSSFEGTEEALDQQSMSWLRRKTLGPEGPGSWKQGPGGKPVALGSLCSTQCTGRTGWPGLGQAPCL